MQVIEALKNKADNILVGGRTSNLLCQEKKYANDKKIILAQDGLDKNKRVVESCNDPMSILDIGPKTLALFENGIKNAKTILLAGPLGKIEEPVFSHGTEAIYKAVAESQSYKVAAGGDTIEALNYFKLFDKFNFVSSGGGAALEFLAKGSLPAIEKLK